MKMVKSLLLGSAAGLVAVTGAQAADLPVKAKAVEYVKVCTLYGAGFYYIPGTDTCIKIGGFLRTEWNHNAGGSFAPYTSGTDALQTRAQNPLRNRTRIITTFDVRSQTEYGTLRAYARAGWQWTTADFQVGGSQCASIGPVATSNAGAATSPSGIAVGSSSCTYLDRAFIQFAGFTFGKTQSYFDFFNTGAYSLQTNWLWVDTGGFGTPVFAYTWQFGNGLSATISAEDYTEQRLPVVALPTIGAGGPGTTSVFPSGGTNPSSHRGHTIPDIVGNLRVDQAWGSAQVMGALHQVAANYYSVGPGFPGITTNFANNVSAHPDDKWGWALGGGITLKMPWDAKDTFSGMVTYCKGAGRYCSHPSGGITGGGAQYGLVNEGKIGVGGIDDAYYDGFEAGAGQLELSKTWSAVAAFEHYWTPTLRSSIYGGYLKYKANSNVVDTQICPSVGGAQGAPTPAAGSIPQGPGCADWSAYTVGTRTIWNPVANFDIGVDVLYTKVNTAFAGQTRSVTTQGLPNILTVADTHVWAGILRLQRNFWP